MSRLEWWWSDGAWRARAPAGDLVTVRLVGATWIASTDTRGVIGLFGTVRRAKLAAADYAIGPRKPRNRD